MVRGLKEETIMKTATRPIVAVLGAALALAALCLAPAAALPIFDRAPSLDRDEIAVNLNHLGTIRQATGHAAEAELS
jgi:hypothetical protein